MRNNVFASSSFYLCCYLLAKGMELVGIEKPKVSNRCNFIFKDAPERESLVQAFNYAHPQADDVLVDAREFVSAIKTLKDRIYQTNL